MRMRFKGQEMENKDKTLKWITSNYSSYIKSIKNVVPALFFIHHSWNLGKNETHVVRARRKIWVVLLKTRDQTFVQLNKLI